MKNKDQMIKATLAAILSIAATTQSTYAATDNANDLERCYGIVKAGLNDCQTLTSGCAGSATQNAQPDAFILLPKGTCAKIVGGSLTIKKPDDKK